MDPIGFGLENFDELGRFRTHDKDRPDCPIEGTGTLDDGTPFSGAKELATLIADAPAVRPLRGAALPALRRGPRAGRADLRRAAWLGDELSRNGHQLPAMVLAFVTHENFRLREE